MQIFTFFFNNFFFSILWSDGYIRSLSTQLMVILVNYFIFQKELPSSFHRKLICWKILQCYLKLALLPFDNSLRQHVPCCKFHCIKWFLREYGFSLTRILPYRDRIVDSVLVRENTGSMNTHIRPYFMHCLSSDYWNLILLF